MGFMFASASTNQQRAFFDQDIGAWNVSSVTDMEAMFGAVGAGNSHRAEFNNGGSPAISGWDVSNVTTMRDMFRGCRQSFDQDISQWPLRPAGVDLGDFMAIDVERAFSEANYSRLLTGWANRVAAMSGPLQHHRLSTRCVFYQRSGGTRLSHRAAQPQRRGCHPARGQWHLSLHRHNPHLLDRPWTRLALRGAGPGESLSTGQDSFETFTRRLPWRTRIIALGGNPEGDIP